MATDANSLGADKLYEQISANIRATDEISFKLLGLVPLISGAAIGTLVFKDTQPLGARLSPALITLFALFAAAVTLGLFRWELRNVQECAHLIGFAGALARERLAQAAGYREDRGREDHLLRDDPRLARVTPRGRRRVRESARRIHPHDRVSRRRDRDPDRYSGLARRPHSPAHEGLTC